MVRDNRSGGGVNFDDVTITTVNVGTQGFFISSHNSVGQTFNGGDNLNITWNVASTNAAPINTSVVNIELSLDGGLSWPITLAGGTDNDGSETVQLPFDTGSTQARLRIEAVGNIFFDVNNFNFTLVNIPNIPAPGQPALQSGSDSGISNSDRITNFDNSTPAKALAFDVPGTTAGDTVAIYSDGVLIGSAVATGGTTTVITDGSTALANGPRNITARRTPSGGSQSLNSPVLQVTIDTIAPALVGSPSYNYLTAPHSLQYAFTEDVGDTLAAGDFSVTRLPSTNVVVSLSYNGGSTTGTLTFPGFVNGVIDDGQYTATLTAAGVTDVAGNPMSANSNTNFFFLLGDANHDAIVNLQDFDLLAANFGDAGTNYGQANFNYDGFTNLADFDILAARFGAAVDSRAAGTPPFGTRQIGLSETQRDELLELLA
jgi:hypothetical protein